MCRSKVSPLERIPEPDGPEETKKLLLDDLLEQTIGGFGKFQFAVMSLACAPILCVAIQVMSWTFVASEQIYPGNSSIFSQWGVEAENRPQIKATIQAFYFMGQLVGSYTTGIMGDRYGRKVTMYLSLFIQSVCGLLLSVAPNWWSFSIMKFGTGFSQPGLYGIACLYSVEMLGKDHRRLCAIIVAVFYTAGMLLIPLAAYYIPNQALFHAVLSAPSFLFMLYWWALPESPRWLVAKGRVDEAEDVIKKAARINNRDFPKDWQSHLLTPPQPAKIECSLGVLDLFRTPKMRKRILVSTILWPTTTMLYYGLTMKADLNGGSLYISYILSTLIELPGIVFIYTLINVLGRRLLLTISLLFCAGFLLANWALAPYVSNIVLLSLLLTSKAGSKVAAQVTYTHLPEMMPTLLRTTAVGYASATGRIGAIMASYITYWMVDTHGIAALIIPFSSFSLVSALLVQLFLPETYGKSLPDTVEDVENKED